MEQQVSDLGGNEGRRLLRRIEGAIRELRQAIDDQTITTMPGIEAVAARRAAWERAVERRKADEEAAR